MKKISILIAALMISCVLITAIVIAIYKNYISKSDAAIQYAKDESIVSTITIENIKSIAIDTPTLGGPELFFDMDKKEHIEMINEILYWLKSGQIIINTKDHEFISHGLSPSNLVIELKDRTIIKIQSSFNGVTTHFSNRNEYKAESVDGQVTIYVGNTMNYIRVLSPGLKSFIERGWMYFFNYNK